MNEKDLSKYFYLKREIDDLEERILTFGAGISSVRYKELDVSGSAKYQAIQEKIVQLKDTWMEKRVSALEEYLKIEQFISNIDDIEIRQIIRYRYLDLKKWDEIDGLLHNGINYSKKKFYKFIKKYPILSQ